MECQFVNVHAKYKKHSCLHTVLQLEKHDMDGCEMIDDK